MVDAAGPGDEEHLVAGPHPPTIPAGGDESAREGLVPGVASRGGAGLGPHVGHQPAAIQPQGRPAPEQVRGVQQVERGANPGGRFCRLRLIDRNGRRVHGQSHTVGEQDHAYLATGFQDRHARPARNPDASAIHVPHHQTARVAHILVELVGGHRLHRPLTDPSPIAIVAMEQIAALGAVQEEHRLAEQKLGLQPTGVAGACEGEGHRHPAGAEQVVIAAGTIRQGADIVAYPFDADGAQGLFQGGRRGRIGGPTELYDAVRKHGRRHLTDQARVAHHRTLEPLAEPVRAVLG